MDAAAADLRGDDDFERLDGELDERLDEDEAFWNDPELPLRDIVERLCRHFSLVPDWSRWDGEGWIPQSPPPWPWAAAVPSPPVHGGSTAEGREGSKAATPDPAPALAAAHELE